MGVVSTGLGGGDICYYIYYTILYYAISQKATTRKRKKLAEFSGSENLSQLVETNINYINAMKCFNYF
jgi:hypothetical protein